LAVVFAEEFPRIPNSYIVVFKPNTDQVLAAQHIKNLTSISGWTAEHSVKSTWHIDAFSGYAAQIMDEQVLHHIKRSHLVDFVEHDKVVKKFQSCPSQTGATWGIARTSTLTIVPTGPYIYPTSAGQGVSAYIIDTGILTAHRDFEGRAFVGRNFVPTESDQDLNGHGTHVAGTVCGATYGIAKKCTLIAVKVLDRNGSGTLAAVIDGINWVASQARGTNAVSNLSLGSSYSLAVNNAINAMVNAGIFTAVAAGNSDADACNYSPASATESCCVGATDSSDIRAYFSNWGKCVDIMAPGVAILSDYIGATLDRTAILSGTSMAAPHVCGVAAVFRGIDKLSTPSQVQAWLVNRSGKINIGDLKGSPDRMLHQGCY